jgi:hypothetical protein
MYLFIVLAFMFVLPLGSGALELFLFNEGAFGLGVFLRWFVFWSVGLRLLLAGLRQIFQPRYTAEDVLGIKGDQVLFMVRELGFANCAIGIIGTLSLMERSWVEPAALLGGVFYALAGINHLLHKGRSRNANIAMVSDLFVAIVLGVLLLPS